MLNNVDIAFSFLSHIIISYTKDERTGKGKKSKCEVVQIEVFDATGGVKGEWGKKGGNVDTLIMFADFNSRCLN